MLSRKRIPVGGRPRLVAKRAIVAKRTKATLVPIETIDGFDACFLAYPWLLPLLDVGCLDDEAAYWERQKRLAAQERRAVKPPWTMAEWNELGPGLKSVVPRPRGRIEAMELAREGVRRRAA